MGINTTIPHEGTHRWLLALSLTAVGTLFCPPLTVVAHAEQSTVSARQGTIRGIVVDQNGAPVPGAYVVVEGTTTGTITDFDGNFSISVATGANLVFSYIGYQSVTTPAADGMKVVLEDDSKQIEEIAVVAYGAQKKVTVTGAISSVKSEDLLRTPVSNVNNVLAGQLSGVTTIQNGGEPGANETDIFVRGKATFQTDGGGQKPLIQVDGVEREMWDIDPNEIESITVLKDASATAVFGVRGANGVILITTKRGKEGKANINVSTAFSALMPTKMVEMVNSVEYAEFYNKQLANDGNNALFSDAIIEKFRNPQSAEDLIRFPSVDWADYIMKDVTLQTQSNISIDGGNDKVKYFASVGLFTQGGVFDQFDQPYDFDYRYKRFNYRSNIDIDVTKYTRISVNVSGKVDRTLKPITGQGSAGMIKQIYFATPFVSPGFVDGKLIYTSSSAADNMDKLVLPFTGNSDPLNYLRTGGCYRQDNNKIQMDLVFDQKLDMLTEGLSFKMKGAYNSSFYVQKTIKGGSVATYTPVLQSDGSLLLRKNSEDKKPMATSHNTGKGRDWYFEASLNYHRTFAEKHNLTALALYNQSKTYYPNTYSDIPRTYVGIVGRVSYDYNNKYMAEFNFGRNGSENFAEGKRFGSFPAASVGWAVSEESFMDNLKPVVTFLKLRASWGLVGNDKTKNRFMYTQDPYLVNGKKMNNNDPNVDHGGANYYFGASTTYGSNTSYMGATEQQTQLNNADVSWEKAFKQDYGIDINFLDNRLSTSFDYYYEKRTDILAIDHNAPSILGFDQPYKNFGEVHSWGWEASVGWNSSINEDWRIWAKLNLSYNQNEIIEDGQVTQKNDYQYTKGHRIGSREQYKFWRFSEGAERDNELYQSEFGQSLPQQSLVSKLKPGDAIFIDLDGSGIVDPDDKSRDYGHTDDPEYIAGLNFGFSWKNLTVSTQWTAAWNVSRMIESVFRQPFTNAAGTTQGGLLKYHIENTWTEENPSQSSEYPRATWTNAAQNYAVNTLYEKDSKYLRLKTAEIGYNFDLPFMKVIGLRRMQLSLSGYNLVTFTPYLWGDPESRATGSPTYPLQRTYTASLKLAF